MPINTDLSQLVFRKSIISEKYKGGLQKFKKDFEFSSVKRNREDNELISLAAMNPDEFDLTLAANNFHRIADEDNFIIGSDDFVIINRYGGKMWYCDWITGDDDEYPAFFWDVKACETSIEEALERCNCEVHEIEARYGSFMKWGEVIV